MNRENKYHGLQWAGFFLLVSVLICSCGDKGPGSGSETEPKSWAVKLGFPAEKKVIILHADDAGMCEEANIAIFNYLKNSHIQSTAGMPPCEFFEEFCAWAIENPAKDMGLHLTLTSEWTSYRWGSVAEAAAVPNLIDPDGFLWHEVRDVAGHATAEEVEKEIRAQVEKAISLGVKVDHLDTHMGTLFSRIDYTQAYIKVAQEYDIPAMVISLLDDDVLQRFQRQGYPLNEETKSLLSEYTLPQLDDFYSVTSAKTYKEKIEDFFLLVKDLKPGLTEIIFHPSVETDKLKTITNAWQDRVWEAEMFSDPQVIQFFEDEGIIFTNWIEVMERFRG